MHHQFKLRNGDGQAAAHAVHVHGKARGLRLSAEALHKAVIPAAGQHRRAHAFSVAPEHHAGVVVDLMHKAEVKPQIPAVSGAVQFVIDLPQVIESLALPRQRPGFVQRFHAAEQIRQPLEGLAGLLPAIWLQQIAQRRVILALDVGPHLFQFVLRHIHPGGQHPEKSGVAQLHMKTLHAAGPQGIHRHGHHFHVGLFAHRANHLHAALGDLAAAAVVGVAGAEHRLIVVEPLGKRDGLELRGRHPGDGSGRVRPHDHDLAGPVDDLQHSFLWDGVAGLDEQIVEFHLRRADLGVAPAAEEGRQRRLHLTALHALGKQPVPGPLRRVDGKRQRKHLVFFISLM